MDDKMPMVEETSNLGHTDGRTDLKLEKAWSSTAITGFCGGNIG